MIAFVLILFFAGISYDSRTLLKKVGTKDKVIYFAAMLISFTLLTLYSLGIPLASPSNAITKAVVFLFHVKQ